MKVDLNQWFEKGLTPENYIATLDNLKEGFTNINEKFQIPNDDAFFQELQEKNLRVIVLSEVWCTHCMLNIPILLHLANKANMPVRILPRDENLDLMDQYLTNEKRIIPIFVFIDEDGNEVAKWGPMAETTRAFVAPYRDNLPPKDAEDYQEKFKEMVRATKKAFSEDENLWSGVYQSLKQTLQEV